MDIFKPDFQNIHVIYKTLFTKWLSFKENELYAIEVKATNNPSFRDVRNLTEFSAKVKKHVNKFLFYSGEEYRTINDVQLIPVTALFRQI